MTSARSLVVVCLIASFPSAASAATDGNTGPIAAAAMREAVRLAAVNEPASSRVETNQGSDISGRTPLSLRWSELAALITAQRAEVITDRGTVKGDVVTVRDEGLLIDVKSASNAQAYSKGNGVIPRNSIALIKLERRPGSWGRNLGSVVGVISGLVVGGYITGNVADSAGTGIPLFLGLMTCITTAGYYAGKQLDTQIMLIRVIE